MKHILAAGSLMEIINIFGHHGQLGHMVGKLSDSEMRTIWLGSVPVPRVKYAANWLVSTTGLLRVVAPTRIEGRRNVITIHDGDGQFVMTQKWDINERFAG